MNRLMIVIRTQTVLIYLKGLIVVAKVDLVVMDKRAKVKASFIYSRINGIAERNFELCVDIISIKLEKYAREKVRNAKYFRFVLHLFLLPCYCICFDKFCVV